jgi:PAS domain-containing protein
VEACAAVRREAGVLPVGGQPAAHECESYRRSFDDAPVGMAWVGPDGRLLEVNPALCEIVGRTKPELLFADR